METAINTLLKNPDLCQKIAENGTQFVQKFNDSIIANLFNELYVTLK
jgi:hypothetical protein